MPFKITDFKIEHSIDFEYNTVTDCHANNCDGICRCATLDDISVESIDITYSNFTFSNKKEFHKLKDLSEIEKYCLNRLISLNGGFDKDNYEANVGNGYYGQEIYGAFFENQERLLSDAQALLDLESDIEKVFFVLNKEYGFIAPIISDCTKVEIVDLTLADVKPSNGAFMLKTQTSYVYDLDMDVIKGIVFNESNLLIDGNHRYSFLNFQNKGKEDTAIFKYIKLS